MKDLVFQTQVQLPSPIDKVFSFFSDAGNLEMITPAWLKFEILTPKPVAMREGAQIDYRIHLRGFPISWRTEITVWQPPHRFVDVQIRGPYHLWEHTHSFEPFEGGTLCRDHVRYYPRGGLLIDHLFVRRDVEQIFKFRQERLVKMFSPGGSHAQPE